MTVRRLRVLYRREPARINALVTGLVLVVLAQVGLDGTEAQVASVVAVFLPALAGEGTRARVTPTER